MPEQIAINEEQLRLALATRPPQTKEEFFLYAKACRFPCESCKGTGRDLSPDMYGDVPCQRCNGEGKTGLHFGRVAVCPGHSAPLDVFWEIYSQRFRHAFIRANRAGGKTKGIAYTEHMMMHHRQFTIAHMGGSEAQANRGRDYFHAEIAVEPWSSMVATNEPGQTKVQFRNGGKIEWLPSTEKQASGPHPELSILDEMDECLAGDTLVSVRHDRTRYPNGMRLDEIVQRVHSGEQIYAHSWSIKEQRFIPNRIIAARCSGEREIFRISYRWRQARVGLHKGGRAWHYSSIDATADHKFLLNDGRSWQKAGQLSIGDRLMPFVEDCFSLSHEITDIESFGKKLVYDLTVENTHTFIGNGVVVSNCSYDVRERFVKTPSGPRAMMIEASTWYGQEGTISRVRKENPGLVERVFCLWETISKCTYNCDAVPLKDGSIGRCPLYEMEEMQADGSLRVVELCGGKLARMSDGHISVPDAIANWQRSNVHSRRVEHLCKEPMIPSSILAYWGYSSLYSPLGNILPFDPPIRYDAPIHWTLDFNINPMSSFIIQQAPLEYPDEWWIVDEFYIFTVSTEWICQEFKNRYGVGGSRLTLEGKASGIVGGLEVYGDWTGHNRSGTVLKSHYSIIQEMLQNTPGFRIAVLPGDVADPIDRLNLTNQMFFDLKSGSKRRYVKIAPRCVNGIREFGVMPRRPGTFEKDKSDRVQRQLGLSHLGDALECWVWKRFPYGPNPGPMPVANAAGQRDSLAHRFLGGNRVMGASSPWNIEGDGGPWR